MQKNALVRDDTRMLIAFGFLAIVFLVSALFVAKPQVFTYTEVEELAGKELNFPDLSVYFTNLAERKGAAYAYEVLKRIPVPPNIDMHLMGHVVGDILYRQEGLEGIKICTHDFRNACSHSIVVGLFLEKGTAALPEIADACRAAPGGSGAYTMCFHGLGHGVLAYADYDMEKAISLCKKTGTAAYHNREYIECVGGTVMELIGGGFHDRELWAQARPKYLNPTDPLGLCTGSIMPTDAREICIVYATPYLFEVVGANAGSPRAEDFAKAFKYCDALPVWDRQNRDACFGGFGKEFVGLALGRDIRSATVANISGEQYQRVYEWCLLAQHKDGTAACLTHAMNSFYWGGENDRTIALQFCATIPVQDQYNSRTCFLNLMGSVRQYIQNTTYKKEFCTEVPVEYRGECKGRLGV